MVDVGIPIIVRDPESPEPGRSDWMTAIAPDTWRADSQSTRQDGKVVWTPRQGRRILFMGVLMSVEAAMYIRVETDGEILVPPVYLGPRGGANILFMNGIMLGVNANLSYSSSSDGMQSVMFYGKEY